MKPRWANRIRSARPYVENLEDRCVLSGFGSHTIPLLPAITSSLTSTLTKSLTSSTTNPSTTPTGLSTPATDISNIETTVTTVLGNVLDTAGNPNITTGNSLAGITSAVTANLTGVTGSLSNLGGLSKIVSSLSGVTGVATSTLTGLLGASSTTGALNLQVNLGNLLGGLNLGGVVGNLVNGLTNLTVNLSLGIGPGLQLQVGLQVDSSLLNTGIVGNLLGPSGTSIGVQVQAPGANPGLVVNMGSKLGLPPGELPPPLPPLLPPPPDSELLPANPLRTDSRGVGSGGTSGAPELYAGGPEVPTNPALPAGEALAAARPQPPADNASTTLLNTNPVPFLRGLFGPVPDAPPAVAPDAVGLALVVPAAPAGGDAAPQDGAVAEGGRGMAVADTTQVAAGLDAAPQNDSSQFANVLADCSPFDLASAEAAMARFLDQVKDVTSEVGSLIGNSPVYPWVLAAAAAAGAFEYRRRSRRTPQGLSAALAGEETVLPWLIDVEGPLSCPLK